MGGKHVQQTCHRLEPIEGGAKEGDEDCFTLRQVAELPVVRDGNLYRGEVESVTCFLKELTKKKKDL